MQLIITTERFPPMKRFFLAAAAAFILFISLTTCMLPPFDAELSLAYATASKMNLEAEIGPLYRYQGDFDGSDYFFLPSKTFGPRRGFIVTFQQYRGKVFYVNGDGSGNSWIEGEGLDFELSNGDSDAFNQAAFAIKDSSASTGPSAHRQPVFPDHSYRTARYTASTFYMETVNPIRPTLTIFRPSFA